jgi:hypothetical protein
MAIMAGREGTLMRHQQERIYVQHKMFDNGAKR